MRPSPSRRHQVEIVLACWGWLASLPGRSRFHVGGGTSASGLTTEKKVKTANSNLFTELVNTSLPHPLTDLLKTVQRGVTCMYF